MKKVFYLWSCEGTWGQICSQECTCHSSWPELICCWFPHGTSSSSLPQPFSQRREESQIAEVTRREAFVGWRRSCWAAQNEKLNRERRRNPNGFVLFVKITGSRPKLNQPKAQNLNTAQQGTFRSEQLFSLNLLL